MYKYQNFSGQPIFSQLLNSINRSTIQKIASQESSDKYYKKFKTYDHLITMLYAVFHRCTSLREVTTGMQACFLKLNHLGMIYCPRKSTLADANKNRSYKVFEKIYYDLHKQLTRFYPDSRNKNDWFSKLYIADSTTISLFKEILKNVGTPSLNGKRKGGIKVHTLIKADQDVPCLVKMNAAASHDVGFIKNLKLPKGSIITFDKGYVDYNQYDLWTKESVYWVTRLRKRSTYTKIKENTIDPKCSNQGVLSDSTVMLGHQSHKNITRIKARLIVYYDKENDRVFQFITNNLTMDASTIALIYKHRWQIEILFKRIKQNYPLQYFLGDNENALKVQIWCALIADLIIKKLKSAVNRRWSHSNLTSMIRIHLMSYIDLFKFLENPDKVLINNIQRIEKPPSLFG